MGSQRCDFNDTRSRVRKWPLAATCYEQLTRSVNGERTTLVHVRVCAWEDSKLKLKLTEWASVAEITSSIAVVITLIVLVLEVRNNTGAMQAATRQSIAGRIEQLAMDVAGNPELAELIAQDTAFSTLGASGDYSLAETLQMRGFITALLRNSEEAYFQMQEGRLDESYFRARIAALPGFIGAGGGAEIYCSLKTNGAYDRGFTGEIDIALAERFGSDRKC